MMIKCLFISLLMIISCESKQENLTNSKNYKNDVKKSFPQSDSLITISAVGDIMLGSAYPSESYLAHNFGINLLDSVKQYIQSADLAFGNLEGSILNDGNPEKECSGEHQCYFFRMKEIAGSILKSAGFDFVNIGNNHIGDFGYRGLINTIRVLDSVGIKYSGVESKPYDIITVKGLKIGIAGFGANSSTINMNNFEACSKIVNELKSKSDIVIVSFHGGGEGSKFRHVTGEPEVFLGEKRGNPDKFSKAMIDAGADLILGHGPHITRALNLYKGKLIVFSLGNFCTHKQFSLSGLNGVAPLMLIQLEKNGKFRSSKVISIKQINRGMPVLDKKNRAFNELMELTYSDFPTSGLVFDKMSQVVKTKLTY